LFKFFKKIGIANKIWKILNSKYFNSLEGKIGSTVIKIQENPMAGNNLIVQTDNGNVRSIIQKNESQIIDDINSELGIFISKVTII
jgi:hypothetical protein